MTRGALGDGASSPAARLQVALAAVLFSTGGAAVKAATLSGWQVAGLRSAVAAVAVWCLLPSARRGWSLATFAVAAAYAATLVAFVLANRLTTAANAVFLQYTAPIYVLLLSPLLLRESIRRRDLLFMLALAAGMVTFFIGLEEPRATASWPLAGNLVAAVSGVTWGLTLLGLRRLEAAGAGGAPAAVLAGNLLAFTACLPMALSVPFEAGARDWAAVLYLGVVQVALAYVLLTRAFRHVRALEASLLLLLELIFSPVWAWLLHREVPGVWALAGGGMILLATVAWTVRSRP